MSKRFNVDDIRSLMDSPENIKNVTVIAHVDHGKSTLTDSLVRMAGISTKERFTDATLEEQQRGISIESCGVSLTFDLASISSSTATDNSRYLINLIDSPGHVDFSSEVTTALRLTDGAIVVVDAIEGVCVQTETVLRQALMEKITPILVINKLDRVILELKLQPEDIYQKLIKVIENVNVLISTYSLPQEFENMRLDPVKGNVMFASAIQGWGFSIKSFSELLAKKMNIKNLSSFQKGLWGDSFYDTTTDKWLRAQPSERTLERGFCRFILKPICNSLVALSQNDVAKAVSLLGKLDVKLSTEEIDMPPKQLMKVAMSKLSPVAPVLAEMIILHLPSPLKAQQQRIQCIYEGEQLESNEVYNSLRKCNADGPLMIYISKMLKSNENRFLGYGRVFSGTAKVGQKITLIYLNDNGRKIVVENKNVKRIMISMGRFFESISDVPAGNIICLDGIDKFITKSGTVTSLPKMDSEGKETMGFKEMSFAVSPVVKAAVRCKNPKDITKLIDGLKKLVKADPCVEVKFEKTGENIIGAAGELHLEVLLKKLNDFAGNIEIDVSDPLVIFNETVTTKSSQVCVAVSANRHNRLYMDAQPICRTLLTDIEMKNIDLKIFKDIKSIPNKSELANKYEIGDIKKLWTFGPDDIDFDVGNKTNLLMDSTKGTMYLSEIKEFVTTGFKWATGGGVLCEEQLRGVRFDILDTVLHADSVHRGANQLLGTTRKVLWSAQLCAAPRLVEPWYSVEILCDQSGTENFTGKIYSLLQNRRGRIESVEQKEGTPLYIFKGFLPVVNSFGFTSAMRGETKGNAFLQCSFSHWEVYDSDPLEANSDASKLVAQIRKRKGLSVTLPDLSD